MVSNVVLISVKHGPVIKVPYYNIAITGKQIYCKNVVGELDLLLVPQKALKYDSRILSTNIQC